MANSPDCSPPFERWIVLDTGALIAGTDNLYALGGLTDSTTLISPPKLAADETVKFFVTHDVASETRDANARNRLQALERLGCIVARAPSAEAVAEVARYAKVTGDYPVLSVTDMRVLALTYMLEVERNGVEYLRQIPEKPVVGEIRGASTVKFEEVDRWEREEREERERKKREEGDADGWTTVAAKQKLPKRAKKKKGKKAKRKKEKDQNLNLKQSQHSVTSETYPLADDGELDSHTVPSADVVSDLTEAADTSHADISGNQSSEERHDQYHDTWSKVGTTSALPNSLEFSSDVNRQKIIDNVDGSVREGEETVVDMWMNHEQSNETNGSGQIAAEYLSEEDDGGWINEDNLEEHLARDGGEKTVTDEDRRRVACVTTDFAMQNTMLQMGLKLLSVDGRRTIRQIKSFALRCHSCGAITRELHRKFCERCGNATMHRVAFNVNKKGIARAFLNPKKAATLRGTKYPIPMPRGGRHNKDLILCEDQIDPVKQKRIEKQRQRLNVDVLDPSSFYNAGARFNPHGKPLIVGYGKRNPNQVRASSKSK